MTTDKETPAEEAMRLADEQADAKAKKTDEQVIDETLKTMLPEDHDPASVVHLKQRLPQNRRLIINRPGHINVATDKGNYPGCRLAFFHHEGFVEGLMPEDKTALEQQVRESGLNYPVSVPDMVNLYFSHRANLLVVDIIPTQDGLWVEWTNQLEGNTVSLFTKFSQAWSAVEQAIMDRDAEEKEAELKAQADKEAEEKALITLGKNVRDQNLIQKLREASERMDKQQKEINRLRKKLGLKAGEEG